MQTQTHYLGMVVTEDGSLLADSQVHGRPSVNDLASLLAHAMRRPLDGNARRPRLVRLRGHHQWRELFSHLDEIGVGSRSSPGRASPGIEAAYDRHLRQLKDEHRVGMVKPTSDQSKVEATFPAIARYVGGYGYIEIGDQESFGFVVRAIGYGGMDFEDDRPETLGRGDGRPGGGPGPMVRGAGRRGRVASPLGSAPPSAPNLNVLQAVSPGSGDGSRPGSRPIERSTRGGVPCDRSSTTRRPAFEVMSKRRRGYPERDARQAGTQGRPRRTRNSTSGSVATTRARAEAGYCSRSAAATRAGFDGVERDHYER